MKIPRQYSIAVEELALNAYREELVKREGNPVTMTRPEPPDALYETPSGATWAEVSALVPSNREAKYLNDFGLQGSPPAPSPCLTTWEGPLHLGLEQMIQKRIQEKDAKESYMLFTEKYGRGVLLLYIDNPLFSASDFERFLEARIQIPPLRNFRRVYVLMPRTISTVPEGAIGVDTTLFSIFCDE